MSTLNQIYPILQRGEASTEDALNLFDALEPVDLEFMLGRWRGSEFPTNHPLDGFLVAAKWYGKEFVDAEQVHPLLFLDGSNTIFKVAPLPQVMNLAMHLPVLKREAMQPVIRAMTGLLKTDASQARLRMTEYRQKVSATMVYDHLPIHDIFRKVDDNTVLGLMDFKGVDQPFFFILKRDRAEAKPEVE